MYNILNATDNLSALKSIVRIVFNRKYGQARAISVAQAQMLITTDQNIIILSTTRVVIEQRVQLG